MNENKCPIYPDSGRIVYEKHYYIKTGSELENYILEEYLKDNVELSSLFFDVMVSMKEKEILETYQSLQSIINGDCVMRLENIKSDEDGNVIDGDEAEEFIPEGYYEDVFTGNCKDFLESFNGREAETGLCRYDEGELLDFIL